MWFGLLYTVSCAFEDRAASGRRPAGDHGNRYALRSPAAKRSTIDAAGSTPAIAPTL